MSRGERSLRRRRHGVARGLVACAAVLACIVPLGRARAFETTLLPDLKLRWDNTVRYTTAVRVGPRSSELLANDNTDDGDRNFAPGFISHRFDLLTELDLTYRERLGARVSAAGWYDILYNLHNDNDSPATFNPRSVPHDQFPHATRDLHGRKLDLLDAVAFVNGSIAGMPVNLRAGRYTLLWGESLLLADNGISYAQAPIDAIKALSVPGTQAKELFLPVGQVSGQVQPTSQLTLAAYLQFEYRRTRVPGVGSYFSSVDLLDAGGERLLLPMGAALFRGADQTPGNFGQAGLSARYRLERLDTDLGLYFINFSEKVPQIYLEPGTAPDPGVGKVGEYVLVFPRNIGLVGASFATGHESLSVNGEVHLRHHTPLASTPQTVMPGTTADNNNHPLYAVGDTMHAQISTVYTVGPSRLWRNATWLSEVGWQGYLHISKNPAAYDPRRGRNAVGLQVVFTPNYFEVVPHLDLSVPLSVGYNPIGNGPFAGFNGGASNGGLVALGLTATYREVWIATLRGTYYFGKAEWQTLRDRHFLSFSVQRTF